MDWINLSLIPAVKSIILIVVLLTGFAYLTLFERKLMAASSSAWPEPRLEVRPGPSDRRRAQDDLQGRDHPQPHGQNPRLCSGPALAIVPALVIFAVIPIGPRINLFGKEIPLVVSDVNVGML